MYFALQEQVRAKLINLLTGRATNRKKRHHRDPPGPLPPGERTLPLGTQCGLHSQRGEGATEPPVTDGTLGGVHRAPPEPQSLTPAQAVWPSIWPSSGDTAALSTRPELAAFSSLRGKTRAGYFPQQHNIAHLGYIVAFKLLSPSVPFAAVHSD